MISLTKYLPTMAKISPMASALAQNVKASVVEVSKATMSLASQKISILWLLPVVATTLALPYATRPIKNAAKWCYNHPKTTVAMIGSVGYLAAQNPETLVKTLNLFNDFRNGLQNFVAAASEPPMPNSDKQ